MFYFEKKKRDDCSFLLTSPTSPHNSRPQVIPHQHWGAARWGRRSLCWRPTPAPPGGRQAPLPLQLRHLETHEETRSQWSRTPPVWYTLVTSHKKNTHNLLVQNCGSTSFRFFIIDLKMLKTTDLIQWICLQVSGVLETTVPNSSSHQFQTEPTGLSSELTTWSMKC